MSPLLEKWSGLASCSVVVYPFRPISDLLCLQFFSWLHFHFFFLLSFRFLLIPKVCMGNGSSPRSVPCFRGGTCSRTRLWRYSWPTEVRKKKQHSFINLRVLSWLKRRINKDVKPVVIKRGIFFISSQLQSCLTSLMQPLWRRLFTVFLVLESEPTLGFLRPGTHTPEPEALSGAGPSPWEPLS